MKKPVLSCGIDIGTNTVSIIVAEILDAKVVRIIHNERVITRLGAGLLETGRLSSKSVEATINTLRKYKRIIDDCGVKNVFTAATSAVREASNSDELLSMAHDIGIDINIISGDKEAIYTLSGIQSSYNEPIKNAVFYDIGGGSTEISHVRSGEIIFSKSIPIGVVKLSDKFGFSDPVDDKIIEECSNYIKTEIQQNFVPPVGKNLLIGTAGSVTAVAALDLKMIQYDSTLVSKHKITVGRLEQMIKELASMKSIDKILLPGMLAGREDLMIPSMIMIKEILIRYNTDRSDISDSGLRVGLAIAAVS